MKTTLIYIVQGSTGEYSDHREWLVKAYADESRAQAHVEAASARARELIQWCTDNGRCTWDLGREGAPTNEHDPAMDIDYTGVNYGVLRVELVGVVSASEAHLARSASAAEKRCAELERLASVRRDTANVLLRERDEARRVARVLVLPIERTDECELITPEERDAFLAACAYPEQKPASEVGCKCQWEAGDSPCPTHGEDEVGS